MTLQIRLATLLTVLPLLLAGLPARAAPDKPQPGVLGTVTSVVDGDSLWITPASGGKAIEVRLAGIDAPEICQEHGEESKRFLAEKVLKQPVRLQTAGGKGGHDAYGRTLGTVYLGHVEVNRMLVEEGQAWSIRTKWDRGPYVTQERMARALSRGLHKIGSAAIEPKDFRQRHGPCAAGAAVAPTAPAAPAPGSRAAAAAAPPAAGFSCDGRTHCNQMRSCAEATYFLRNCPGVQMDGNHDGIPCEQQWCKPR